MDLRILMTAMVVVSSPATATESGWITAGEAAWSHLQKSPGVHLRAAQTVERDGAPIEKIYLLELVAADTGMLARALHRELKHCGGFMFHASEAEGRRALSRVGATPLPMAARPSYVIANQAVVAPMLAQMEAQNIGNTILRMSAFVNRFYTSTHGADASAWLRQAWTDVSAQHGGISVEQFSHAGYQQKSVIATIRGSDPAAGVVVIGAHLDSINIGTAGESAVAPGADDDASGIAGITELLRVIAVNKYQPRRTIKLIGYAAEEVGLRGSQDIARAYKKGGVDVVGVLQLDMTNYMGSSMDIYLISDHTDAAQNRFVANLIAAYLPTLAVEYDQCGYACSDHASWDAQGYPSSMPFESAMAEDNPNIHGKRDTYANSGNQATHALKFARMAAAYAIELGSEAPAGQ